MAESKSVAEPQRNLSSKYTGWRPNCNRRAPSGYNRSSEKERIGRSTSAVLGKLTPDNLNKLLPKIKQVYATIHDRDQLEMFLSIIFQRAIMEPVFHLLFATVVTNLLSDNTAARISDMQFKRCVLALCDRNVQTHLEKMIASKAANEFVVFREQRLLISVVKFIAILSSNAVIESAVLIKYLHTLLHQDTRLNETHIEAACAMFTVIFTFVKLDNDDNNNTIYLMNAEKDTIAVDIKSHVLVYGYMRHTRNVPQCVLDCCIGYYDVNAYFRTYYQKLQTIEHDALHYSTRIRMLIKNITSTTQFESSARVQLSVMVRPVPYGTARVQII